MKTKTKGKLFLWNWVGGGYNSCRAKDCNEALKKGNAMTTILTVDAGTLREATFDDVQAEDKRWGPYD